METKASYREITEPYVAALRMVREAIGDLFGPAANLESEEAELLRGPEPHHTAEAIIAALQNVGAAAAQDAEQVERLIELADAIEALTLPDDPHTNSWQLGFLRARKQSAELARNAAKDFEMSQPVEQFNVLLAGRVSDARKSAGKTQQQIADALGCHVNIVQRFEAGKHRISAYDLSRLAEAIGVPVSGLFALASVQLAAAETANCCVCGRIIDTREEKDGGDKFGAELSDGRWTCSFECNDVAIGEQPAAAVVGEPVAYASSKEWRKNHLMSAAQYKSALSKNIVDFDIPLYPAADLDQAIAAILADDTPADAADVALFNGAIDAAKKRLHARNDAAPSAPEGWQPIEADHTAGSKLSLWFFRDLSGEQRGKLFGLFGMNDAQKDTNHGYQAMALKQVLRAIGGAK